MKNISFFLLLVLAGCATGTPEESSPVILPPEAPHHTLGGIHWKKPPPGGTVSLVLAQNVNTAWLPFLEEAAHDWSVSAVFDMKVSLGSKKPDDCTPTMGRVEVCNAEYGMTGWLGLASVWFTTSSHIVQGTVMLNDSYFALPAYASVAWRRFVTCQEIGHTLGLAHQDEKLDNVNLGSCMDYTLVPQGPLSNEHPNSDDMILLKLMYNDNASLSSTTDDAESRVLHVIQHSFPAAK